MDTQADEENTSDQNDVSLEDVVKSENQTNPESSEDTEPQIHNYNLIFFI